MSTKKAREIDTGNRWVTAMDKALEADPPIIDLVRKPNGVYRLVVVYDPHMDGGHNVTKTHCKHNHEFTPENTIITRTGRQCRTCKNKVTSEWQKTRKLTPEQKARKNERERARRRQQREEAA